MRTLIGLKLTLVSLALLGFMAVGQVDTSAAKVDSIGKVLQLTAIEIQRPLTIAYMETPRYKILLRKDIEALQAADVGEILQKLEGVSLKSYGGLGGLKTIAVRSLGGQHSAITVDGFSIQNHQTGQVNLAQIQTNNLNFVVLGVGEASGFLNPVSAQISGNNIALETFEMTFMNPSDSIQLRSNVSVGSFGQINGYGSAKVRVKKGFIAGFGNYRLANGKYSYSVQNGDSTNLLKRTNNDYQDQYFGAALGYEFKHNLRFRLNYKQAKIEQGLPGAVIFYNNSADERLSTSDKLLSTDLRFDSGRNMYFRLYASANMNEMRYLDPTYFNSAGKLDVNYTNRALNAGLGWAWYVGKNGYSKFKTFVSAGVEYGISDLLVSDTLFALPLRQQASGIGALRHNWGLIQFRGQLSAQYVNEQTRTGNSGKEIFALNPSVALETKELRKFRHRHRLWYRNSLRIPSFNELYYNAIGNIELRPEKANQFGYNLSLHPYQSDKNHLELSSGLFFNRITDMIVAIPTQNLFVWSMQNVGIVHAMGADVGVNFNYAFKQNTRFVLRSNLNYSFQRSVDVTDDTKPTYGHQIAYIPMHTGNADLSLEYKSFGGRISNYLISKRYSLNENNSENEVQGFVVTDFSLFHTFKLKSKQTIRVQLQLKNAFNESYTYIRSFVMPGRNYLISISYAFN